MKNQVSDTEQSLLDKIITILLGLPWTEALTELWNMARKAAQRRSTAGMYEVLDYESTLELRDRDGKRATFRKREQVRYLQDTKVFHFPSCTVVPGFTPA